MVKMTPKDRWLKYLKERIKALKVSGKIDPLRAKGLAILHRNNLYTSEEWWQSFHQRAKSPEYRKWYDECEVLAHQYGLVPWVVTMLCLLDGYDPEKDVGFMVMERDWPRIRIITDSINSSFLWNLAKEAQQLGLYVVSRYQGLETTLLNLDVYEAESVSAISKTLETFTKNDTFKIDVETPLGYPPEAASQLQKEASRLARELAKRIGHHIPKRLRTSKLVALSEVLEIEKGPLPKGKIYDIVDEIYSDGDLSEDQKRRKLIASRRHRLRKRLNIPGNTPTNESN